MGEGDLVIGYQTIRATHDDEFPGVPATNKSFQVESMSIVRFANGNTAEHWAITDVFDLMQQIGAMERLSQERNTGVGGIFFFHPLSTQGWHLIRQRPLINSIDTTSLRSSRTNLKSKNP